MATAFCSLGYSSSVSTRKYPPLGWSTTRLVTVPTFHLPRRVDRPSHRRRTKQTHYRQCNGSSQTASPGRTQHKTDVLSKLRQLRLRCTPHLGAGTIPYQNHTTGLVFCQADYVFVVQAEGREVALPNRLLDRLYPGPTVFSVASTGEFLDIREPGSPSSPHASTVCFIVLSLDLWA